MQERRPRILYELNILHRAAFRNDPPQPGGLSDLNYRPSGKGAMGWRADVLPSPWLVVASPRKPQVL